MPDYPGCVSDRLGETNRYNYTALVNPCQVVGCYNLTVPNVPAFGEMVCRLTAGFSLRQIGKACAIDIATLGRMRHGHVPRPGTIARLAVGLNVTPEERAELFRLGGSSDPTRTLAVDPLTQILERLDRIEERLTPNQLLGEVTERVEELDKPDLADVDVRTFAGAENLSEHDIELVNRVLKQALAKARKQKRPDS